MELLRSGCVRARISVSNEMEMNERIFKFIRPTQSKHEFFAAFISPYPSALLKRALRSFHFTSFKPHSWIREQALLIIDMIHNAHKSFCFLRKLKQCVDLHSAQMQQRLYLSLSTGAESVSPDARTRANCFYYSEAPQSASSWLSMRQLINMQ